jgi:hypothetical protein
VEGTTKVWIVPNLLPVESVGKKVMVPMLTVKVVAEPVPQSLVAVTEIVPTAEDGPKETVMVLVPCPAVIEAPAGTVHA